MKASNLLVLFFIIVLLSTGLFFSNANALELRHYYEENTVCAITTNSTVPIQITDGTEFDFVDGEDYLIALTTSWNGASNANLYEIKLQHGNSTFEGSNQIVEPKDSGGTCTANEDLYKYFFWTIWSPVGASQASENIILNFTSIDGTTNMVHDDVTIFVLNMGVPLEENTNWFFDENTTDNNLDLTTWNTNGSATLSFTPTDNNDDWLIFGNALLGIDDVATQHETRLNFGNETFSPLISKEGENIAEQFLQPFSRVFTLNNTQSHTFKIESRNDGVPVGTNERLYNSIFAMNLNTFDFHNSSYNATEFLVDQGEYNFNLGTLDFNSDITADWFIFGGFAKDDSKRMEMRLQVDDVDQPSGQTTQTYDFNDGWDADDEVPSNFLTVETLDNSTHTLDIDASMGSNGVQTVRDRSLFAFVLNAQGNVTIAFDDPFSWNDLVNVTIGKSFDDSMSLTDFINITTTITPDDSMSMLDDIRIDLSKKFTDPFSWNDLVNVTIGKSFDDSMSLTDFINITTTITPDDSMSMLDDIRIDIVDVIDDSMSWIDLVNVTIAKPFDVPMSMTDDITFDISDSKDDLMSILDDIRLDIVVSKDDSMSMPDDITIDIVDVIDEDAISWTDTINIFISFGTPPIVIPPTNVTVTTTGGGGAGQAGVSSPTIPDSDGDGFLDNEDQCPNEPETFNNFQDLDGCPDFFGQPEPITIADLGFPFGFNELSIVPDFINLETDSPQPQVEDLGIRWLGDEPITITKIDIGSSPFEIQFQDLPVSFGNNQFGFTQEQIIYTVQEPDKICTTTFSFDCVDDVTYEIPVVITGEVRGKTVIAEGSLTIDNSNRFNPYWYILFVLILIPFFAFFLWKRNNSKPTTKEKLKVTQAESPRNAEVPRLKPLKAGTTRRTLTETQKTNVLGKKTK